MLLSIDPLRSFMEKMPVLIIADGENARLYYTFFVNGEKICVCTLKDSLDCVQQRPADVIMLDCGFNVCRGLRALRKIKAMRPETPVIFLTDLSSEDTAVNAFRSGAREYFRKPVNIFELKATLQRLLALKRTSNEKRTRFVARKRVASDLSIGAATTDKPVNLLSVIHYIEENLSASIKLESLAKKANSSKYHFCRIFKRNAGASPMQFVTNMRIERAKDLLRSNGNTISAVAYKVGFKDLSNFTRQFKKITGTTPMRYKNSDGHVRDIIPAPERIVRGQTVVQIEPFGSKQAT